MRTILAFSLTACLFLCARPSRAQDTVPLGSDISVLLEELTKRISRTQAGVPIAGRAVAPAHASPWRKIPSAGFSVPDYPALGSPGSDLDFRILHDRQKNRSAADCRLAQAQRFPSFRHLFDADTSPLSEAEVADMGPLMDEVFKLGTRIAGYYKQKYSRPRPFETDSTLTPCAPKPGGRTAYPSSHALVARLGACVLGAKYEDRARVLAEYGNRLGELRATVGVHHPSDVAAGQDLALQICARLLADDDFRRSLGP